MSKVIAKSSEMPDPKVVNYSQYYELSNVFINDLKKVLDDLAYVDARKFYDKIDNGSRVWPISKLNEFISDLSYLPYKIVGQLMNIINNKEYFLKYFIPTEGPKE